MAKVIDNPDYEALCKVLIQSINHIRGTWPHDGKPAYVYVSPGAMQRLSDYKIAVTAYDDPYQWELALVPVPAQERAAKLADMTEAVANVFTTLEVEECELIAEKLLELAENRD